LGFWVFLERFLAGLSSGKGVLAQLWKVSIKPLQLFYLQLFGCQKLPHLETQSQVSLVTFLERVFTRAYVVSWIQCNFFLFWLPKLQLCFHLFCAFFCEFVKFMLTKFSEVQMFLRPLSRQLCVLNVYYKAFLKFGHF